MNGEGLAKTETGSNLLDFPLLPEPGSLDLDNLTAFLFDQTPTSQPPALPLSSGLLMPPFVASSGDLLACEGTFEVQLPRSRRSPCSGSPKQENEESGEEYAAPVKATRKAEQNRRAQARFRQRKREKIGELEEHIQKLNLKLKALMQEKETYQEEASLLQQVVEEKDKDINALKTAKKASAASEDLVDAFWDFVIELKRGRQGMQTSRSEVADMVNEMLQWHSLDLGFIRREAVHQLVENLQLGGQHAGTAANRALSDIIAAYNKMVHRCGEVNPLAFRTFLSLQLAEQSGLRINVSFWHTVVDAGGLSLTQKQELVIAYKKLLGRMQHLMSQRDDAGLVSSEARIVKIFENMTQTKDVLDLHAHILKEEQAAVCNFRTIVGLVLEPVQQARLMVASFPFALDSLAICSVLASGEDAATASLIKGSPVVGWDGLPPQIPGDSPFQALSPNSPYLNLSCTAF